MADISMTGQRGTTIGYQFPVVIGAALIDLTLPNTVVVFTAKRRRGDATALITKTYRSAPGTPDAGFGLAAGSTNTLDLEISPADTAPVPSTGAFEETEFLVCDVVLTEPTGRETAIAKGALTVRAGVGT